MTDESHGAHPSQSHQPVDPAESPDSAKASESEPTQPDAGPLEPQDAPDMNGSQNPHPQKAGLRRRTLILGAAGAGVLIVGVALQALSLFSDRRCCVDWFPTSTDTEDSPASAAYRPAYHYSPTKGNLADPNGLVLHEGEYHLFHQQDGTWGHAISSDMVHWKRTYTALEHDSQGLAMSGSCVVDGADTSGLVKGGGMVAVYTSTEGGEAQSLAYSTDRGRSWQRFSGNPVIPNDGRKDFRDPKVFWHEGSQAWVMIVSVGDHVSLFRSRDLKAWTHASDFGQGIGSHAAVWECPDLFPLTDTSDGSTRWVMTLSVGANEETAGSTAQYFIGDFDGSVFFPEDHETRFTDAGQDFYAAQSFENIEGRRVWMAWLGNWNYPYSLPTGDWRGEMSIPRELSLTTLDGQRVLVQKPVPELDALRGKATDLAGLTATDTADDAVTQLGKGRTVEIDLTLDVSQASEAWLGLARGEVDGSVQEVRVGVNVSAGTLYLDRTNGGLTQIDGKDEGTTTDFALRREVSYRPTGSTVRLHLYLDRSSVEVFVDDGATVGSLLVFTDPGCQEIVLGAAGTATITSGSLTPLAGAL